MAKAKTAPSPKRTGIVCVRCGRVLVAADPGTVGTELRGLCPGGCPLAGAEPLDGNEPERAAPPAGPPPVEIPPEMAAKFNAERPFVELTLIHTGQYTGPTRGRVLAAGPNGFTVLTEKDGVFLIPWSNLAYWRYLPEV